MPPLPADSIHARACKLKCEKILTRPPRKGATPLCSFLRGERKRKSTFTPPPRWGVSVKVLLRAPAGDRRSRPETAISRSFQPTQASSKDDKSCPIKYYQ